MTVRRLEKLGLLLLVLSGGCRSCNESAQPADAGQGMDGMAVSDAGPGPGDGSPGTDGPPPQVENEQPPASLGADGIVLDQLKAGDAVKGAWVSITGWVDPKRWSSATVIGAPAAGFYATTSGHLGVPTVPVLMRDDGRFVAPRVPLADGMVELVVAPLGSAATFAPKQTVRVKVAASDTASVPVTVTASRTSGAAPLAVTFTAKAGESAGAGTSWEWDFDGDARSDAASDGTASHTFSEPGVYGVTARVRGAGGRWVYGVASVAVAAPSEKLDEAAAGTPTALSVVTDYAAWNAGLTGEGVLTGGDDTAVTRAVLLVDGDSVKVFDAHLKPQKTLGGLSQPRGVAGDAKGLVYVSDTNNDRLVRFAPDGTLDMTFGQKGVLDATRDGTKFKRPGALALGYTGDWSAPRTLLLLVDGGNDRLVVCSGEPVGCDALAPRVQLDDAAAPAPAKLNAVAQNGDLNDILFAPPGGPFPAFLADGTRLLGFSRGTGGARFAVVDTLPDPVTALAAVPARGLRGMSTVAAVLAAGDLGLWLAGSDMTPQARRESLPFSVTALAFDPYATAFRANEWRKTPNLVRRLESGPVVVYVAGAGTIQRRVLSSVEARPW